MLSERDNQLHHVPVNLSLLNITNSNLVRVEQTGHLSPRSLLQVTLCNGVKVSRDIDGSI